MPWSITQTGNITDQLNSGFRYLDIRCCWDNNEWRTHHALLGDLISDMMYDIKRFIEKNTYEVIIIDIGHTDYSANGYNDTDLMYLISDILGDYMISSDKDIFDMTFDEMWESNKRLIFTFDSVIPTYTHEKFFYLSRYFEGYYANSAITQTMLDHNDDLIKNKSPSFITVIPYILTPDTEVIMTSILPKQPKNVIDLSKICLKKLSNWLHTHKYDILGTEIVVFI